MKGKTKNFAFVLVRLAVAKDIQMKMASKSYAV